MLLLPILPARTLLHTVGGVHSSLQWYRSAVEDESGTPCVWVRTAGRAEHGESWTTQGHIVLALPAEQVAHPIQAQTNNTTPNASTARLLLADRTVLANIQLTRSSELMQEIQRMRSVIRTLEEQIEVTTRSLEAMDRLVVHLQRVTDLLHEVGVMPAVRYTRWRSGFLLTWTHSGT
ncbi:hypothetical protein PC129_g13750 [Phytophthora cactorum]|uniref:Uncharacterized protein n=1 Tax=Phytophthora cactorum TaxID=29920 RepID=A0A329SIA4_9STRA|nr:hypothetical protein PC111_g17470 [Phytophthora cactorum]KAG2822469.1 hypothetical protein PC112_g10926 [Phytophthora cactorum]KAG2851821.1 hypothetical protein PC113_g15572 [Phytophthora cactorum]KAG2891060.1 hypothetical protein PC114_g17144 [Phytophthora cactorum]KAG2904295.1 hypothetical protein PC115_g15038 [Phytophthora cactorum]